MRLSALLLLALVAPHIEAQTSFPMINMTHPTAVQRGKATEVAVSGTQNFAGVYKALFEGTGIQAEIVNNPAAKSPVTTLKLKITVDPKASLGVREYRLASLLGLSSVGQLVLVDDPVVLEAPKNDLLSIAQPIQLPCVLAGKLEVIEDLDYFKFEAKAGEIVTFEMHCARIQDKIHDLQKHAKPMLSLFDGEGRELAANDTFFFADPMLSYTIQKDGTYFLQIRESTYDGDPRWVYSILATNRPYVSHIYPMAGNPGKKIDVEPIGSAKAKAAKIPLDVPNHVGVRQVQLNVGEDKTYPATFVVSSLPQFLETEPNDDLNNATKISLPAGINGRIGQKRDADHFQFEAKKGQNLRFELKARRFGTLLQSSLHGILEVVNPQGALLVGNDDSHGKEAALLFKVPADGPYILRVRDLNSKGGDSFVYFVEAEEAQPDFTLRSDPDKAMIGPGSSTAWFVHVVRQNGFAEPVKIEVKNLPREITASALTIPATMTQGVIVLTAEAGAAPLAQEVEIVGTAVLKNAEGKETTLVRPLTPNQEIYSPGGGRAKFDVNTQMVAVTELSDLPQVKVNAQEIDLKPGQEFKIEVEIERKPDYDKSVSLDIPLAHLGTIFGNPLPPGVSVVTAKSKTLLPANGNKGFITIKAAPNAEPIERVPISVLAHVSINFVVKVSYSSPVIHLTVSKK